MLVPCVAISFMLYFCLSADILIISISMSVRLIFLAPCLPATAIDYNVLSCSPSCVLDKKEVDFS